MTDLPPNWEWTQLDYVSEVRLGRQRSPKNHTGDHMRPYLRAANVGWQGLKLDDVKSMNFTDREADIYRLQVGDIVLAEASGSAGEVGKPALWRGEIEDCCLQNTLIRVRSHGVEPAYLFHFIRAEALRGGFVEESRGVGIHHLGAARLAQWPVPVPPLPEQRRIVDVLEEHLPRAESASRALDSVTRRITVLTRRIILDAVPEAMPRGWRLVTVGEAGAVDLGRQRHPDWHQGPNMRPYLRVANVFEDRFNLSDVMEMDFTPEVFERFRLREGDILLNEGQSPEYLGRPAMYRGHPKEIAFTNSLLRFRSGLGVDPEWALLVFRRHLHAGRFMREVRITTNIAHLSATRFKSIEFPVPPIEVQRRLVGEVRERLADVARLANSVTQSRTYGSTLRQSLLAEAFAGRLAPQDPNDEPATALLERIRRERASHPAARQAPKTTSSNETQGTLL